MRAACIYEPEFLFQDGRLRAGGLLGVDDQGVVQPASALPAKTPRLRLPGKALLPGLVNAHSHAFQRLIRGRTELLTPGHAEDDFWSWRESMYRAVETLDPDELYVASRQAFLEMARSGITTVGEFHYVHHAPDGTPYAAPNTLALAVIRAAREVGLRITLLRVGYARAGFGLADNPRQRRFYDRDPAAFLEAAANLTQALARDPWVKIGLAPHSVRAVPRAWLEAVAKDASTQPLHMHVAEQPAEVAACLAEHGLRPVALLESLGLLSPRFTAVHAIHLEAGEILALGRARAHVCACPSTEMNLGDGVIPADLLMRAGVSLCLGSDSQAEIDLLSEARQLEGHLRLVRGRRVVLDDGLQGPEGLARRLLSAATSNGAQSLGWDVGALSVGQPADFFTLDTRHPSLAGFDPVQGLSAAVWTSVPGAVSDVVMQGRHLVSDGHHTLEDESARDFSSLQRRIFP